MFKHVEHTHWLHTRDVDPTMQPSWDIWNILYIYIGDLFFAKNAIKQSIIIVVNQFLKELL